MSCCAAEKERGIKEKQRETAHDAVFLHAGLRPPVSLAKNKPGRRGEDSSPLSFIYLHLCLSFVSSSLSPHCRYVWMMMITPAAAAQCLFSTQLSFISAQS